MKWKRRTIHSFFRFFVMVFFLSLSLLCLRSFIRNAFINFFVLFRLISKLISIPSICSRFCIVFNELSCVLYSLVWFFFYSFATFVMHVLKFSCDAHLERNNFEALISDLVLVLVLFSLPIVLKRDKKQQQKQRMRWRKTTTTTIYSACAFVSNKIHIEMGFYSKSSIFMVSNSLNWNRLTIRLEWFNSMCIISEEREEKNVYLNTLTIYSFFVCVFHRFTDLSGFFFWLRFFFFRLSLLTLFEW